MSEEKPKSPKNVGPFVLLNSDGSEPIGLVKCKYEASKTYTNDKNERKWFHNIKRCYEKNNLSIYERCVKKADDIGMETLLFLGPNNSKMEIKNAKMDCRTGYFDRLRKMN